MTSKEKIIETIRSEIPYLKKEFHIKNIGIFGSVSKDISNEKSDVDIIVEFSVTPGFITFVKLKEYLSLKLKRKIDLVTKKALKPQLKDEILKETIYV